MRYLVEMNGHPLDHESFIVENGCLSLLFDVEDNEKVVLYRLAEDGTPVRYDRYLTRKTPVPRTLLWNETEGRDFTTAEAAALRGRLPSPALARTIASHAI